jgi:hypothetical protein
LKKKKFIKNRPFDENDALQMQDWAEEGIIENAKTLFSSGVVFGLDVLTKSLFKVQINIGKAFDKNYKPISINSLTEVSLDAPNSQNRYDSISLKFKTETTDNIDTTNKYGRGTSWTYSQNILDKYDIIIRKGTPGTTPIAPTVPNDEIHLANILVRNGATSVASGDIVDKREMVQLVIKPDAEEFGLETPEGAQDKANSAQTAAINWAKSFGLGGNAKTYSANLNDISETGFYYATTSAANRPENANGYLINITLSETHATQMFIRVDTGKIHRRVKVNGLWSNWEELETTAGAQSKANTAETNAKNDTKDKIKNVVQRYVKQYAVNTNSPAIIKEYDDSELSNKYIYFITARTINTGSDVNTIGIFKPNDSDSNSTGFTFELLYSNGSSNAPELFIDLDGKPSVRLYNHTSMYTAELTIEKTKASKHLYNVISEKISTSESNAIGFAKSFGLGEVSQSYSGDLNSLYKGGFYYANSGSSNKPGTTNGHVIVSGLSNIYILQLFVPNNVNAMYMRINTSGTWTSWERQENTAGAQSKVNVHIDDKNNPHNVTKSQLDLSNVDNIKQASKSDFDSHANNKANPHNVTSSQVNNIQDNAFNATEPNTSFPNGVSVYKITTATGFPYQYGLVTTIKNGSYVQQFFDKITSGATSTERWFRTGMANSPYGWSNWIQIETIEGSQAKVDATQIFKLTRDDGATKGYIDGDLNTIIEPGFHGYTNAASNKPDSNLGILEVQKRVTSGYIYQKANTMAGSGSAIVNSYERISADGGTTWGAWEQLEKVSSTDTKIEQTLSSAEDYTDSKFNSKGLGAIKNLNLSMIPANFDYGTTFGNVDRGFVAGYDGFLITYRHNGLAYQVLTEQITAGNTVTHTRKSSGDMTGWNDWTRQLTTHDFDSSPLWLGAQLMADTTTVTPNKKLSECRNGWVLIWSDYDNGVGTNDFQWVNTYIHKKQMYLDSSSTMLHTVGVINAEGSTPSAICNKDLTVYDNKITGHIANVTGNWANDVCLRAVYEF